MGKENKKTLKKDDPTSPLNPAVANTKTTAQIFGVHVTQLGEWKKKGCPQAARGWWFLPDVLKWYLENLWESKADKNDDTLINAKRRHWIATADMTEFKRDQVRASLVDYEDIEPAWVSRRVELARGHDYVIQRIARRGANKAEKELEKIVEEELNEIREKFFRTGKYCDSTPKQNRMINKFIKELVQEKD